MLSKRSFKPVWRSAIWNYIRPKPGPSTARTGRASASIRTSSLSLGYCFRPRLVRNSEGKLFCGFNPAVSTSAMRAMRDAVRELNIRSQTQRSLNDIAKLLNPILRGWIEYYGRFIRSALYPVFRYVNQALLAWVMRKFRRFKEHKTRASLFFQRLVKCPWIALCACCQAICASSGNACARSAACAEEAVPRMTRPLIPWKIAAIRKKLKAR